jgi:signal peptidase II
MADETEKPELAEVPPVTGPSFHGKWKLFAIVAFISLVADQATKLWARHTLPVEPANCQGNLDVVHALISRKCIGKAVGVIDNYWDWRLSMNPGSAFGLFSGTGMAGRILLSVVGIAAVGGMIWMLRKSRVDQRILHWALAFVAGGAIGNLIDRIYFGVVTDFVLWRYKAKEWPVFNIADVVLVVGVGLMFIDIQKEGKKDKAAKKLRQAKAKAAGLVKH